MMNEIEKHSWRNDMKFSVLRMSLLSLWSLLSFSSFAATSEIRVDLKLDASDFVTGERIRGVISIANSSPDTIGIGGERGLTDHLFVEVYRTSDMSRLTRTSKTPFVADFEVETGGQVKLETLLGEHFAFSDTSRYTAKPVFVHAGVRYEGQPRVFDIVEGVRAGSAMQMFTKRKDQQREFELVYWSKNHSEHLYLKARDVNGAGKVTRRWQTRDLGPILRIDKPTVSVLTTGEIVILHRLNPDQFVRTEFWSLTDALEFRSRMAVSDPETAGTARVRELYKESGVKPKSNPWWKFW